MKRLGWCLLFLWLPLAVVAEVRYEDVDAVSCPDARRPVKLPVKPPRAAHIVLEVTGPVVERERVLLRIEHIDVPVEVNIKCRTGQAHSLRKGRRRKGEHHAENRDKIPERTAHGRGSSLYTQYDTRFASRRHAPGWTICSWGPRASATAVSVPLPIVTETTRGAPVD